MCAWRLGIDMSTEGSWQSQRVLTVNNERVLKTWKASSWKKCFERIHSEPECVCKFANCRFSSVFQMLQMRWCVFCNLADTGYKAWKQIRKSWKKNYTHVAIQVQAFLRKPKKLTNTKIFSSNNRLKAWTEEKQNHWMVSCICDQILSENIYRNINHKN